MTRILQYHPKIVQSHKDLIFRCLDDKDESIRLRALNLLHGMVTKKNLIEIVRLLMRHVASPANGTHYRNELVSKLVHICSQDNYHYVNSFEWYISVLVELSRTDGVHCGTLLSDQLIDVAIRVPSVRSFCVAQMAVLFNVCASTSTMANTRQNALHDVVHAASWICGEYAKHMERPRQVLEDMISTANQIAGLPGHIQSVLVMNTFKLYCSLCNMWTDETDARLSNSLISDELAAVHQLLDRLLELTNYLMDKFTFLVNRRLIKIQSVLSDAMPQFSPDFTLLNGDQPNGSCPTGSENGSLAKTGSLAVTVLSSIKSLVRELASLFSGEINPVAPKAQRKVPVPDGLNLDERINPLTQTSCKMVDRPHSLLSEQSEVLSTKSNRTVENLKTTTTSGNEIFSGLSTGSPKNVLTPEQLEEMRQRRLEQQQRNPHYLKPITVNNGDRRTLPEASGPNHEVGMDISRSTIIDSDTSYPFANPDQFAEQIQRQLTELSVRRSNKVSLAKKSQKSKAKRLGKFKVHPSDSLIEPNPAVSDPEDVGDVLAKPLVRVNFEMPEGTQDTGDSPTEPEDLNDPHRRLDIVLDGLIEPLSTPRAPVPPLASPRRLDKGLKRSTPTKRQKNGRTNQRKFREDEQQVSDLDSSTKRNNATELAHLSSTEANSTRTELLPYSMNRDPQLIDPSDPDAFLSQVQCSDVTVSQPNNSSSIISPEQFLILLSGTQLTATEHCKVRCPAAATALATGETAERIFPLVIDSLVQQLPGQLVESLESRACSLYMTHPRGKNPVCLLLKFSHQTGSFSVTVRTQCPQVASQCMKRIKTLLKHPSLSV
ncbi:AP-3 complex subunit delta-1 [Fasciola gigantica]|uniref:AP-3 complex subunit delta-1 n=1 Tax=Fasciola gigantica TaxID=46835 RepID=A0A504YMN0_FASGI|nr:AP-3 complex subunit delta-1 [Fasciola gigantica]